jgi:hypothetical protein
MTLAEHGWPPGFLLMYDEPWIMTHQIKDLMRTTTSGNELIMDFALFHVGSGKMMTGKSDDPDGPSSKGRGCWCAGICTTLYFRCRFSCVPCACCPATPVCTLASCEHVTENRPSWCAPSMCAEQPLAILTNAGVESLRLATAP